MKFDLEIVRRPGVKHQAAHALSRLPNAGVDKSVLQDEVPVMVMIRTESYDQKKSALPRRAQNRRSPSKNADDHYEGLPTLSKLIIAQFKDMFCKQSRQLVGLAGNELSFDKNRILIKRPLSMGQYKSLFQKVTRLINRPLRRRGPTFSSFIRSFPL